MAWPSDILDGLIATMNNAADALMQHQGQANKVRTKATRTTVYIYLRYIHLVYLGLESQMQFVHLGSNKLNGN